VRIRPAVLARQGRADWDEGEAEILDVVTEESEWGDWSASMLASAAQQGRLVINPLIYAEVAGGFTRIEDLDVVLPTYFPKLALIAP
jgi:hypothetical protein